ncbi:MAG: hypothetical protein COZ85_00180 [Candidatus Moranbacteria bacterium CG_4_8_14_3_um_filter_34_16]|nr:MAG: hypothetical protein COT31_00895 [Candidatus Moranbacteria bacterium CG08_land_8_20_14_0_20_34_16]PIW95389.1 MAG: hypothetical protein COZ85_00180 [Candidatus Moranbacteria bacterium CG_4_8_14_3_um_filter_34_16]PJA89268.1 MAG: hypothetical protein CO138_01385 [Candidatus Moranbacteria bacterium CG_4_9_14_3_um_filter_33_15]
MKLKILLAPVTLLASMVIFIWLVYPTFSDPAGGDGVKEEYQKLSEGKKNFEDANEKVSKVNGLWNKIESSVREKDILFQYIPEKAQEEEIIDNINLIFSSSGVSISDFSVSINNESGAVEKTIATEDEFGEKTSVEITSAEPVDFVVNFSVFGKYEYIKEVLQKINNLGRYNQILNLTISEVVGEDKKSLDVLEMEGEIGFNYMKKKNLRSSEEITLSDLDMDSIASIKEKKTVDILKLPPFEKGRSNPFSL